MTDIMNAYNNLIGMLDEYTNGLYIPTNETMNWNGIKFNVRQQSLSLIDVWENEYGDDVDDGIRSVNADDLVIQDDEWEIRERYRQERRDNAHRFYDALHEYIMFLQGVKVMDESLYKDLIKNVPNFIMRMNLVCYKQYDYLDIRSGDGKAITISEALEYLVNNYDSN